MTQFKIVNGWENKAKEYGYGYQNRYGLRDKTRRRRMSRKDEKTLLNILIVSDLIEINHNKNKDGISTYIYRG